MELTLVHQGGLEAAHLALELKLRVTVGLVLQGLPAVEVPVTAHLLQTQLIRAHQAGVVVAALVIAL